MGGRGCGPPWVYLRAPGRELELEGGEAGGPVRVRDKSEEVDCNGVFAAQSSHHEIFDCAVRPLCDRLVAASGPHAVPGRFCCCLVGDEPQLLDPESEHCGLAGLIISSILSTYSAGSLRLGLRCFLDDPTRRTDLLKEVQQRAQAGADWADVSPPSDGHYIHCSSAATACRNLRTVISSAALRPLQRLLSYSLTLSLRPQSGRPPPTLTLLDLRLQPAVAHFVDRCTATWTGGSRQDIIADAVGGCPPENVVVIWKGNASGLSSFSKFADGLYAAAPRFDPRQVIVSHTPTPAPPRRQVSPGGLSFSTTPAQHPLSSACSSRLGDAEVVTPPPVVPPVVMVNTPATFPDAPQKARTSPPRRASRGWSMPAASERGSPVPPQQIRRGPATGPTREGEQPPTLQRVAHPAEGQQVDTLGHARVEGELTLLRERVVALQQELLSAAQSAAAAEARAAAGAGGLAEWRSRFEEVTREKEAALRAASESGAARDRAEAARDLLQEECAQLRSRQTVFERQQEECTQLRSRHAALERHQEECSELLLRQAGLERQLAEHKYHAGCSDALRMELGETAERWRLNAEAAEGALALLTTAAPRVDFRHTECQVLPPHSPPPQEPSPPQPRPEATAPPAWEGHRPPPPSEASVFSTARQAVQHQHGLPLGGPGGRSSAEGTPADEPGAAPPQQPQRVEDERFIPSPPRPRAAVFN
eukprot:Hpha_TRINITY_DN16518_c3_g4::TRINITY_DN16518_c3_g4_i1::g.134205::m.134205